MAGTQEKIRLLLKIAHRLNEVHVEWALGASMLLYFKDITSDPEGQRFESSRSHLKNALQCIFCNALFLF